jgi:hypothetical protein
MVGFVAAGLGWWQYRLRRAAVDGLLAVVPSGIALTGSLSSPERDPTFAPDRVRYITELSRVAAQHGDAMAESELAEALRKARLRGEAKSMSGALAALLWMGQGSPASVTQITRTARGSDLPSAEGREMSQVRCLAIHVLGRVAHQDDGALRSLIETVEGPDESFQHVISASAANELGGLGARAKGAVPALMKGLAPQHDEVPLCLLRYASINALGRIGPDSRGAAAELIAIAEDRGEDEFIRLTAIRAVSSITVDLKQTDVEPTESHARIVTALARLLRDGNLAVRKAAGEALGGVRHTLHLSVRTESLLGWFLRTEEKTLSPEDPEVVETVGHLKRLYLVRGKKAAAAKLETRNQGIPSPDIQ